jgi:REP element-mobilizing transposase RayT
LRYFITFACYGTHLHGAEAGSVDRRHNLPGSRLLEADAWRASTEQRLMTHAAYLLDEEGRSTVLKALREVCSHRGWSLLAAHVRPNHVHLVVEAEVAPEIMLRAFKSYASRSLGAGDRKRWARHGSTRWLWKDQDVLDAIWYVVEEQGEAMAVFVGEWF